VPADPSRRDLPDPGFAGDEGGVAEDVAAALEAYRADPHARPVHRATLAVLQHSRVLVPVVAVLGEVEHDAAGRAHDKTSDMATVLLTGDDGRTALLAFTGARPLGRWDPAARPVPVTFADAARAARQDGADAVVVDVAGPVMFVVDGDDLDALADGQFLVRLEAGWAWARTA
jgi:hypothetical protein